MRADIERRYTPTEFEVRSNAGSFTFYGYALKWNTRSQNLGGFHEQVREGATKKTIQEADIRALFNHDKNLILGRNKAKTLRLAEDSTGLHYEVDMPDTTYARDLAVSMERGDITQSSFGFRAIDDDWELDESDFPLRSLNEMALSDVSPVTYAAYLDTTSGLSLGTRALERLAETRGLSFAVVEANLAAVVRGDELEPESEARTTTPLSLPVYDLPVDPVLALRVLTGR